MSNQPKVIRKVVRVHKAAGSMNGKPKVVRDLRFGLSVERVKALMDRPCGGPCIWDGTIKNGEWFARVDEGVRRQWGKVRAPVYSEYHFSCLPGSVKPMRRFFELLPYEATLCLNDTEPTSKHLFHNVEEWEAWMATHYPGMKKQWSGGGNKWRQHGIDYRWCRVDLRPRFQKPA